MFSWKQLLALPAALVRAVRLRRLAPRQPEPEPQQAAPLPLVLQPQTLALLAELKQARSLRQAAQVLQLAALLPLEPLQLEQVTAEATRLLLRLQSRGGSSPKNTRSKTTRANSTARHRHAR